MRRARIIYCANIFWIAALACAEPASIRVTVDVREQDLAALRIAVAREGNSADKSLLACTFPAGEKAELGCLLEDGSSRWDGGASPLSFILYGRPGTKLVVGAAGLRELDSTTVATSTEASVEVPEEGTEIELELVLVARSSSHASCTYEIVATGSDNRTSVTAFDLLRDPSARPELIATSGSGLAILQYRPVGEGCGIFPAENLPDNLGSCQIQENSLVAGRSEITGERMVAGICGGPQDTQLRLQLISTPLSDTPRTATAALPRSSFSRLAVADLNGDERSELYSLRATRPLSMAIQRNGGPVESSFIARMEGLSPFMPQAPVTFGGPLVVRERSGRDALIIAGYNGGISVVTAASGMANYQYLQPEQNPPTMGAAAAVVEDDTYVKLLVAVLYGRELRVTELLGLDQTWMVGETWSSTAPNELTVLTDRDVRLAIGDLEGNGQLSAVTVHEGTAIIFPLQKNATVRSYYMWGPSGTSDVQTVLLANVDGMPGADIIAYGVASGSIYAINGEGRALDGWPLSAREGTGLRVVLAELDSPNAPVKNMEVVTLSGRIVQVFSLGPGSYDPQETAWPMRDGGPGARGVLQPPRP